METSWEWKKHNGSECFNREIVDVVLKLTSLFEGNAGLIYIEMLPNEIYWAKFYLDLSRKCIDFCISTLRTLYRALPYGFAEKKIATRVIIIWKNFEYFSSLGDPYGLKICQKSFQFFTLAEHRTSHGTLISYRWYCESTRIYGKILRPTLSDWPFFENVFALWITFWSSIYDVRYVYCLALNRKIMGQKTGNIRPPPIR